MKTVALLILGRKEKTYDAVEIFSSYSNLHYTIMTANQVEKWKRGKVHSLGKKLEYRESKVLLLSV